MAPLVAGLREYEILFCHGRRDAFVAAKAPPWVLHEPTLARAAAARISSEVGGLPVLLVWRRGDGDVRTFGDRALAHEVGAADFDSDGWVRVSIRPDAGSGAAAA